MHILHIQHKSLSRLLLLLLVSVAAMANNTEESGGDVVGNKPSAGHPKVKLMCSYGGKIQPRPPNQQLVYIGGDTKLLTVDRNIKFSDVIVKLGSLCNINSKEVAIKYQFPGEDLDVLISLINDDDLENMMFEYDRLQDKVSAASSKPSRFRLFLSRVNSNPAKRSADNTGGSEGPFNPDYLFGFDKEYDYCSKSNRKSGFDLGLWTIPSTVRSVRRIGGDEKDEGNEGQKKAGPQLINSTEYAGECAGGSGVQLIYRVPPPVAAVNTTGFHGGCQYKMLPIPMGVVNGFVESPVYNVVASVPERMKIPVMTTDRISQKRNV